jgi:hypothetical protein
MVKNNFIVALIAFFGINLHAQKDLKSVFPEKWKTKIGVTTYRTNMVFHNGKIFIGSNGEDRNFKNDDFDGVYEIDAKSGKILHHYTLPFMGDNDVNGVAIADGKLFFGTDNYYFFCFDLTSKQELWKFNTPYDVESVPQLADLNGDKIADVFFSVEGDYYYALDGKNGELIWKNEFLSSNAGNCSALKFDINADGVFDFLTSGRGMPNSDAIDGFKMAHYGDFNMAIDGKTGKTLWANETGAGVHASPNIYKNGNKTEFLFLDCYGDFRSYDAKGTLLKYINFGYDNFSSPSVSKDNFLVIGKGAIDISQKSLYKTGDTLPEYIKNEVKYTTNPVDGRISATSLLADVLARNSDQIIGVTENGFVFISKTNGELIENFKIPAGAEASLLIEDLDGDKFLEILIADLSGNLTCYKTKSKARPTYGKFK